MSWPKNIESLRADVIAECRDIPPDLVLAVIQAESGGVPGRPSAANTQCGTLVDINGTNHKICQALGLMQTIPAVVNGYNLHADKTHYATVEDMIGNDDRSRRIQIAAGCWYIAAVAQRLRRDVPDILDSTSFATMSDNAIELILLGYRMGAGGVSQRLQTMRDNGRALTYAEFKRSYPDWGTNAAGKQINRPYQYVDKIFSKFRANRHGSYGNTRSGDLISRAANAGPAGISVMIAIVAAGWAVRKYIMSRGLK